MSGNWAIAIADYDNDASNTLKLQTGDKIFDCRVDVNTPEWSVGTGECFIGEEREKGCRMFEGGRKGRRWVKIASGLVTLDPSVVCFPLYQCFPSWPCYNCR